jgi:hypothetical protein
MELPRELLSETLNHIEVTPAIFSLYAGTNRASRDRILQTIRHYTENIRDAKRGPTVDEIGRMTSLRTIHLARELTDEQFAHILNIPSLEEFTSFYWIHPNLLERFLQTHRVRLLVVNGVDYYDHGTIQGRPDIPFWETYVSRPGMVTKIELITESEEGNQEIDAIVDASPFPLEFEYYEGETEDDMLGTSIAHALSGHKLSTFTLEPNQYMAFKDTTGFLFMDIFDAAFQDGTSREEITKLMGYFNLKFFETHYYLLPNLTQIGLLMHFSLDDDNDELSGFDRLPSDLWDRMKRLYPRLDKIVVFTFPETLRVTPRIPDVIYELLEYNYHQD